MSQQQIEILQRALKREKTARKEAEKILEDKSRELFSISQELKTTNAQLNDLIDEKSSTIKGLFENINDAYLVMDLDGNVLKMNDVAVEMFGYDLEKESFNIPEIIYKEDEEYAYKSFTQLKEKGSFNNYIARVYTKSKDIKWLQINATIIYDKENKPIAAQGIVRDITKDKKAADLLQESENRLAALVLNLNSGILLEDENRKIVSSNKKYCELFEIDALPQQLLGIDFNATSEENKLLFKNPLSYLQRINEIVKAKKPVFGEQLEMVNGKVLERNYTPIIVENNTKGYLWTFRDITLEKNYNLSLKAEKEKYSNIIANMHLGLVEINTNDEISMVNQSFLEMSGYNEKDLLGKVAREVFQFYNGENVLKVQKEKRLKGEATSFEFKTKNKSGETKYWFVSAAPNYNLFGENIGAIALSLDITKIKTLQLQKEQILKELENSNNQLQEYAHIVSHDLKSPLRSINALVSWIKMDNEGKFDKESLQNFDLINTTLETMESLISDVLEYSSAIAEIKNIEDIDLNNTINDLKTILFIPDHIKINVLKKLPIVKGDKPKFQQLFQNFISNAIKFCDKEIGTIEIDYEEKHTFHQFSIKDNGIGIEKKYHDKIFQIFHSLNAREDSTGIGLSIVKKIIDLHQGDIWLDSEPGKGTTFYFTLKKI